MRTFRIFAQGGQAVLVGAGVLQAVGDGAAHVNVDVALLLGRQLVVDGLGNMVWGNMNYDE